MSLKEELPVLTAKYEVWKQKMTDKLLVSYEEDRETYWKVMEDKRRWDLYSNLMVEAWDVGQHMWICSFCQAIEYVSGIQMFNNGACDIAEGGSYPERPWLAEGQTRPDHTMPALPEDWIMSTQGPVCAYCRNPGNDYKIYKWPEPKPTIVATSANYFVRHLNRIT